MKPAISFVLQLSPSTAYENLEAVARNLLDGLDVLLESGIVKCSLFMDGPTIAMLRKVAKPLAFGRIRDGIANGIIEFLGGGFHDPMLPLFPEELQSLQLKEHRKIIKSCFDIEPQGYFNSSLVWEMGMTFVLERAGFDYALVSEAAIRTALGRSTPTSGWFTVEDRGSLMRLVPVADELSKAIENDSLNWREILTPYCRDGKTAVVLMDLPPLAKDIVDFFGRLVDFVETNDVQTWPVGYMVNQLPPDASLSYIVSAGRKLGLPSSATTCREMLIRRPEINMLQKAILNLFRRGETVLEPRKKAAFYSKLMPAMSPIFFRDLGNAEGMQSLNVRQWCARYAVDASNELDSLMDFSGLRMEVCDYMLQGRKQIWVENADFSCLLDYSAGGVLRSYNYKPISASLLNAWRNDGEPSLAFLDCLLPNMDMTPGQIERALAGRESLLKDPYDYQIERVERGSEVNLLEEQGYTIGEKKGVFQVGKKYEFKNSTSEVSVSYNISNSLYLDTKCFFGSIFELGILENSDGIGVTIDGSAIKWDKKSPILYPEAKALDIRDYSLGCVFHMKFEVPAAIFIGPMFGASNSAAPDIFQGIRVYPFWRTALNVMNEKNLKITVSVTKG
ncbi:MAG: DUF1926 domain-containing protein [Fibrobacter sp.]|nr:DUF1926 domain-containing protein [Fibrobacter sp.]